MTWQMRRLFVLGVNWFQGHGARYPLEVGEPHVIAEGMRVIMVWSEDLIGHWQKSGQVGFYGDTRKFV